MDLLKKIIDLSDVYDEPSAMAQEPRIKVAELDNFNTPDLEQSPDSFLRPGETLEDWDVSFRRPNAQGGRIEFKEAGPVKSKFYAPKAAETKKLKATKKLKDFVEKFKLENNGQLPTQDQIKRRVGGKTETIQKYLTEGVDYAKRITRQEAGRLAGLRSGEVRAVPEGQDPSYVKRAKTLDEANKFLSKQDKADFKQINAGKKAINKYFKSKPELINTTDFGKNIKALLSLRMNKDSGAIFSKVRPDSYYIEKAREGKLLDIFDIKAVKEGGRSLRFPTNINITPSQFNQVFIQSQVGKYFAKGVDKEALKNVENILKEKNIKVKLPNVGYVGADEAVAVTGPKGKRTFPKITKTLESMQAPEEILKFFKDSGIPCIKGAGGNCTTPEDFRKGFNQLVKEAADGKGSKQAISKLTNFTKGMRKLTGAAKWTGYGLLAEAGFMVPFAVGDYAAGESWKRILGNATNYGFGPIFGQSEQEEFEAALPEGSKAVEAEKAVELSKQLRALDEQTIRPQGRIGMDQARREKSRENVITGIEDKFKINLDPFLSDTPFAKDQWHQGMWTQAHQDAADARARIAKEKLKRLQKRRDEGVIAQEDWMVGGDTRGYMGGGIVGIRRPNAIPPERQGLRSIMIGDMND